MSGSKRKLGQIIYYPETKGSKQYETPTPIQAEIVCDSDQMEHIHFRFEPFSSVWAQNISDFITFCNLSPAYQRLILKRTSLIQTSFSERTHLLPTPIKRST